MNHNTLNSRRKRVFISYKNRDPTFNKALVINPVVPVTNTVNQENAVVKSEVTVVVDQNGNLNKNVVPNSLWRELHLRGINYEGKDDTVFINSFGARIPRYYTGCKCQEFWTKWIKENPPTFGNYFVWTVRLHNGVNIKLNKPVISIEDARKLY